MTMHRRGFLQSIGLGIPSLAVLGSLSSPDGKAPGAVKNVGVQEILAP